MRVCVLARSARDAVTPLGKGVPAPLIQAPALSNADMKLYVYDLKTDNFAAIAPASSNADMKLYVYDLEADNFASGSPSPLNHKP
ncbi:hypothetical protein T484DRAFT_1834080 [Baffinella frigidus]|nr:hypothetical protein T484DRAFT_1834080 [Cryptophyta sp. CCMP2293]